MVIDCNIAQLVIDIK